MRRNFFFINVILFSAIVLLGVWFYKVWVRPLDLPAAADRQQVRAEDELSDERKERPLDRAAYNVISEKDLFRPSRTALKVSDAGASAGVISQDTPKLFGTIIKSDKKFAILEDPITRTTKLYGINDSVAGYFVNDIQQDRVVLLRGAETVEVKLRDLKTFKAPVQRSRPVVKKAPASRRKLPVRRTTRRTPVTRTRPQQPRIQPGTEMPGFPEAESEQHPFEAQ
ncbi:hypothetical protein BMS3Abin10_01715 [bacterium BMS3Abin10]|nr:hypothetical protein BMS3Abin10_01715 [bacterium BMS3Abin10]